MYCENCGHKLNTADKFCTHCGTAVAATRHNKAVVPTISDEKWWYRLLKVAYILLYLPLPLVLWIAWALNASSYDYYSNTYQDTSGLALWYTFLTLLVYMAIARLTKIATLYVAMGKRPQWAAEFKKIF